MRRHLWLTHGCGVMALYGDDGEMQCSECGLDFKRDDVTRIDRVLHERAGQRAASFALASAPAPAAPSEDDVGADDWMGERTELAAVIWRAMQGALASGGITIGEADAYAARFLAMRAGHDAPTPAVADALARAAEGGRLAEQATLGPWSNYSTGVYVLARMGAKVCQLDDPWISNPNMRADAEFIAWCRANVPLMREDVRALAAQLARAEGERARIVALLAEVTDERHPEAAVRDALAHMDTLVQEGVDARNDRDDVRARLAAAERVGEVGPALRFAGRVLHDWAECPGDIDGFDVQDMLVGAGLLAPERVTGPCGDGCNCADVGVDFPDECFRPTDAGRAALNAARANNAPLAPGEVRCVDCGTGVRIPYYDEDDDHGARPRCRLHGDALAKQGRAALPARPSTPAAEGENNG